MTIGTHIPRLEVIGTVAQVADLAIDALEHKEASLVVHQHQHSVKLEQELSHQRSENQRLKAELDKLDKILQHFHDNSSEGKLLCGDCAQPENCPLDVYERIRNTVDSSNFLEKLCSLNDNGNLRADDTGIIEVEGNTMVNINVEDPSWWIWVRDDMVPSNVEERCGLDDDWYIVVTEEDIVDAIALFIANSIVSDPQAKKMTPEQLQKFVSNSFERMNRKNIIKKLWNAGKFMYSATTWGIAAVGVYRHPFLLRAAMRALLVSGRILVRAL